MDVAQFLDLLKIGGSPLLLGAIWIAFRALRSAEKASEDLSNILAALKDYGNRAAVWQEKEEMLLERVDADIINLAHEIRGAAWRRPGMI